MSQPDVPIPPIPPLIPPEDKHISMRRAFFTGLGALLPVTVTVMLLVWVIGLIGDSVAEPINAAIIQVMAWITGESWTDAEAVFRHGKDSKDVVRGLFNFSFTGYIAALLLILAAGFALLTLVGRQLYRQLDRLLARLPIMRMIYPHVKQLTDFLFSRNKMTAFRSAVLVEYPRKGLWSLGFVTGPALPVVQGMTTEDIVSVFMPSSPTPFTGYVVAVPRKELIELQITVEAAIRYVVSGGVLVQHVACTDPVEAEAGIPGGSQEPAKSTESGTED